MIMKKTAIKISGQPFGDFFVTKFKASELIQISYSEAYRKDDDGTPFGHQRVLNKRRIKDIKEYVRSVECGFPNTIILAANCEEKTGLLVTDEEKEWTVENKESDIYEITIPSQEKLAAIIDGQHRVFGFTDCEECDDMELACSVYFDLPQTKQAVLFATINSTQKAVSKSLAYELFGYEVLLEREQPDHWSPDKLAISLGVKLNRETASPFYGHVKSAAPTEKNIDQWLVSVAALVDSILKLISASPKNDRSKLMQCPAQKRNRQILHSDKSPLRHLYLNCNDLSIYKIITNFFNAVKHTLKEWGENDGSAINKTIGIQGLFDVLNYYIKSNLKDNDISEINMTEDYFESLLKKADKIDFKNDFFLKFSGVGRNRVRDAVLLACGLKEEHEIKTQDLGEYKKIISFKE